MCLQRKKIYTNAHKLYQDRYIQYEQTVPCGHCTECRKDKSNEWRARTYYQYLETIKKGGYILWDRLSYDDKNLPHLAGLFKAVPKDLDFVCFNGEDTAGAIKRLRTNLTDQGYNAKDNIKYLLAAEYGQEEGGYIADKGYWREATLRPHYHIILYCTEPTITPEKLSIELKKAWGKGTTNGVEDNPKFFRTKGKINKLEHALNVSDYIGKYCMKNQEFDKVAAYKVKELMKWYYKLEHNMMNVDELTLEKEISKPEWRKRKNKILLAVKTFHSQSNGYGKYALEHKGAIRNGSLLGMPDKKKKHWWQKLPMYYVRKIYYDRYYDKATKKVIWYLNDTGKEWKLKNLQSTINNFANKLSNLEQYFQSIEGQDLMIRYNKSYTKGIQEYYRLNDLLYAYRNNRDWKHFAEYIIYHKGRIWEGTKSNPENTIRLNAKTPYEAFFEKDKPMYYNYVHTTDIDELGRQIITTDDLGDVRVTHKRPIETHTLKPRQFAKSYCINQETLPEWNDYDDLAEILQIIYNAKEWEEAEKEGIHNRTELTWKGIKKTLYQNII